ncbi:hypothetical protein ACFL45_09055 [Candidatus Neomarinimicrobiota bacterium]
MDRSGYHAALRQFSPTMPGTTIPIRRGEKVDKTHTKFNDLKKAPDGKVVDGWQVSSEELQGLLKCRFHSSNLLSMPDSSGAGNIGKGNWLVVRLVREGLVHEVREKAPQNGAFSVSGCKLRATSSRYFSSTIFIDLVYVGVAIRTI